MQGVRRRCPCGRGNHESLATKTVVNGRVRWTGRKSALRASQAYPSKLGMAIVHEWRSQVTGPRALMAGNHGNRSRRWCGAHHQGQVSTAASPSGVSPGSPEQQPATGRKRKWKTASATTIAAAAPLAPMRHWMTGGSPRQSTPDAHANSPRPTNAIRPQRWRTPAADAPTAVHRARAWKSRG